MPATACATRAHEARTVGDGGGGFRITLTVDKKARTLTVADNGIGMNRQSSPKPRTIARSDPAFVEQVKATAATARTRQGQG